jgi:hypothetical protein
MRYAYKEKGSKKLTEDRTHRLEAIVSNGLFQLLLFRSTNASRTRRGSKRNMAIAILASRIQMNTIL